MVHDITALYPDIQLSLEVGEKMSRFQEVKLPLSFGFW